jgi:hypothetical protein
MNISTVVASMFIKNTVHSLIGGVGGMGLVKYLGAQPISLGGVLQDAHEVRRYQIDGFFVDVFVNGESLGQYMNTVAVYNRQQPFPVGRKSKAIFLRKGYGVWLLVDEQGFSMCHLYVIPTSDSNLDYEQLDRLISYIEEQFSLEWEAATALNDDEGGGEEGEEEEEE